jgi:transcriptional regulatory protein GAL4
MKLTTLLKSLNPDVDIENLLENGIPDDRQPMTRPSPKSPQQQVNETSPSSSHDYEWHEAPLSDDQVYSLQDGMALLSTDPTGSGYLGKPQYSP